MTPPAPRRNCLAPHGRLRAALNYGNSVLVGRDAHGQPRGISVDLARALAADMGLEVDFICHDRAADVSATALDDAWDVCFLAVDPHRAETLDFTPPYVGIEGRYLAGADCDAAGAAALVASGLPVGTVRGSAYTLALSRAPGAEALVVFETAAAALAALESGRVAAVAGIGAVLTTAAASRPGSRLLSPPFMEIRQAMAVPRGRPSAAALVKDWLAQAAGAGRVGDILERHGVARACALRQD